MPALKEYNSAMSGTNPIYPRQWELILANRPMNYNLLEGLCLMLIEELEYAVGLAPGYEPRFTHERVEGLLRKWEQG